MRPLYKGLIIAAIHVALVTSLGAKLLYDRHTRPRVWAQARPYDPDLPIRGRYLSLQLIVDAEGFPPPKTRGELSQWDPGNRRARLEVRNGKLVAVKDDDGDFSIWFTPRDPNQAIWSRLEQQATASATGPERKEDEQKQPIDFPIVAVLQQPVLYFIPEHAKDPTPRPNDSHQLWAEVTIPKKGPPRPIQIEVREPNKTCSSDGHPC